MTWATWIGKWHVARSDAPRLALCGANLALVRLEQQAVPKPPMDRCKKCTRTSLRRVLNTRNTRKAGQE